MTFSSQIKDLFFFLTTCPKSSSWDQEIKPWSLLCAFTAKKALQLRFTSESFLYQPFLHICEVLVTPFSRYLNSFLYLRVCVLCRVELRVVKDLLPEEGVLLQAGCFC